MRVTLGFDVYGTLINTEGVIASLEVMVGHVAQSFSQTWRDKQLEYSFRRGLMRDYVSFDICTRQALEYTCDYYNISLTDAQREVLLSGYSMLPVFADVEASLARLHQDGYRLFAFSNGTEEAVTTLLKNTGINRFFDGVVSCDDLSSFKPNPDVYTHFMQKSRAVEGVAWLISSNPFDVIGAQAAGLKTAWVQRSKAAVFDPWGIEPLVTVSDLGEFYERLKRV